MLANDFAAINRAMDKPTRVPVVDKTLPTMVWFQGRPLVRWRGNNYRIEQFSAPPDLGPAVLIAIPEPSNYAEKWREAFPHADAAGPSNHYELRRLCGARTSYRRLSPSATSLWSNWKRFLTSPFPRA